MSDCVENKRNLRDLSIDIISIFFLKSLNLLPARPDIITELLLNIIDNVESKRNIRDLSIDIISNLFPQISKFTAHPPRKYDEC